jgi:hypothetical protein
MYAKGGGYGIPLKVSPETAADETLVVADTVVPVKVPVILPSIVPPVIKGLLIVTAERSTADIEDTEPPNNAKDETPVPPLSSGTVSDEVNSAKEDGVVLSNSNLSGVLSLISLYHQT